MEKFEESVLEYICGRSTRFVNAQFDIPHDGVHGGSCPDFVVVDFEDRTIYVVEVSSASNIQGLLKRVRERESRWVTPLREHFASTTNSNGTHWEYHITIFVRSEQLHVAQRAFSGARDVSVMCLDDAVFPWRWDWSAEDPANPLRAIGKERYASSQETHSM